MSKAEGTIMKGCQPKVKMRTGQLEKKKLCLPRRTFGRELKK